MGYLGLSVLLLAVDVWLVMDCASSLDVESASVSVSSGLELVVFCDSLVGSLDSLDPVGAGESGLDPGMACVFGFSLTCLAAELSFTAMSGVKRLTISSGVSTGGLEKVELLCTVEDGLARVLAYLFW